MRKSTRILTMGKPNAHQLNLENKMEHQLVKEKCISKRKWRQKMLIKKVDYTVMMDYQLYRGQTKFPREQRMKIIEAKTLNKQYRDAFIAKNCEGHLWYWRMTDESHAQYRAIIKSVMRDLVFRKEDYV